MSSDFNKTSKSSVDRNQRWEYLLAQVSNQNEDALGTLYDESNKLIYSLVLKILNNVSEAEEVTLDVYKYVWKNASNFDSQKSNPTTWLVMIARSRAIDKIRLRKDTIQISDSLERGLIDTNVSPEKTVLEEEIRNIVQNALMELTPKQRTVIELAYFYQISQTEIAELLDMPVGSVKSSIRLGKEKLKNTLVLLGNDT